MELEFTFDVPGATEEEVMRGFNAAVVVFLKHKVSPLASLDGFFARDGWSDSGGHIPFDEEDERAIEVWQEADSAAVDAVCADWAADRERPASSGMNVVKPEGGWPDQPPEGEDAPDEDGQSHYDHESRRDFAEQYDRAVKEMEERRRS
ncbi:hypothetical protein [Chelatococcus asaccharovorans]|uniref:hypothetical protein n=1 Tax=Chelatococcus asaccharovorans TaxID=28210 RepID=UPI00224C7305|nr:hypothetical protein [Chelatococcus asaccharovorans]CAH1672289.1 conserved hypothetical protein [Chelatococcus asaccharovorans]CAH1676288.1 conserved hypothetical protein [Chelatococcus asaccharovorans]